MSDENKGQAFDRGFICGFILLVLFLSFAVDCGWVRPGDGWKIQDKETGCEYLVVPLVGGITPRLGADGLPICGEVSK